MRILIVHNLLWSHYKSSVFQAIQQLADRQADIQVNVLQIARNERSRAGLEAQQNDQAPVYAYNYELLFDRFWEDITLRERITALFQHARQFRPDVINLTGYYDPAQMLLLLWAKAKGIRVIMQNESTAADHQRGGWKERLKRAIFSRCDGFFCFGNQSADYLMQLGVKPEQILLRKNAVDNNVIRRTYQHALTERAQNQQKLSLRPHNFIFVGRLIAFKNLPMLLTAFANAQLQSARVKQWGLILLGDGPERDQLHQQIEKEGLMESVTLLPGQPWYKVPDVLAMSDVLVLPSRSEPWGLVVNEAMVCGMPVLVSDRCGCVPDLVQDGKNGFIFKPDQTDLLTQLLLRFMNDEVDKQTMSAWAEKLIAPYAPEVVAKEMLDGFNYILTK